MFKIFIFFNSLVFNYCCYKNEKNNIDNFEISTNIEENIDNRPVDNGDNLKKGSEDEKNTNNKNKKEIEYQKTSFYHDGTNCVLQTVFLDLMVIFDYFPELFEEFKTEKNYIKDKCDQKYRKDIIDEIIDLRKRYLQGETGINTNKIYNLFDNFNQKYIKSFNFEDLKNNKNFRSFFDIFHKIVDYDFLDLKKTNEFKKYLNKLKTKEELRYPLDQYEFLINEELKNFKSVLYKEPNMFTLINLLTYLNTYISNFIEIEKKTEMISIFKNKKNKKLFKITYLEEDKIEEYSKIHNKIIILNLKVNDKRIAENHSCNVVKEKDNIYYHNSCNYKTIVSTTDFDNFNIQNILNESKKCGNYPFEYINTKYYVELI